MLSGLKNKLFSVNPFEGIISRGEYARLQNLQRFEPDKTVLFGNEFLFSDNLGFLHSLQEIFNEHVYKFHCEKSEPFIIDAGSNIGLSVTYFKQQHPGSRIIAFEPDPLIYGLLAANVLSFGFNNIDLRNAAVWVEDTELTFFSEGSLAGSTEVDFNFNKKIIAKAERLKSLMSGNQVDFLKIDIEGAENVLMFDIEDQLSNVNNLFLEYHGIACKEQKLGDLLQMLTKAGFRYYIKSADDFIKLPFIERVDSGFDLQLNIFCYRKEII